MTRTILLLALVGASSAQLVAHHSFAAEFDASKAIRVTGTLTKVEWTNPHIYFYLDVKDEQGNGRALDLRIGRAWRALAGAGSSAATLKLGDTIVVDGYRAKNGANLMDARRVTLADGRIVSGASAGDGGPQ